MKIENMKIEIDQSGKIEQTNINTILALSNDIKYTLVISSQSKKQFQIYFRKSQYYKIYIYLVFAIGVSYLIKFSTPKSKIIVDREYFGHEALIKRVIIDSLRELKVKKIPVVYFGSVGKSSPADKLAYKVAVKQCRADKIIKTLDILKIFQRIKK